MRDALVWRTLKPFQPSRTSLSDFTRPSAAPRAFAASAPAPTMTAGRSASGEGVRDLLRKLAEQLEVVADPADPHAEVGLRPDGEDLRALALRLAEPHVDQRRFPARVRPDEQDRIRILDARDGRIEVHRREARDVIGQPRLAAFEQGRALPCQQCLCRVHRLGVEQVAGDGRDARARRLQLLGEQVERLAPRSLAQLALLAHPRPVEPVADQRVDVVARLVADPLLVHVVVDAREDAHDLRAGGRRSGCSTRPRP